MTSLDTLDYPDMLSHSQNVLVHIFYRQILPGLEYGFSESLYIPWLLW